MELILVNTMSSGLYNSIKYFLFNKKDKNIIIDPFSCIIKLGLLSYMDEGTKISISDNQINFNCPNAGQGLIRYLYGDGREDLHNLFKPIQKSVEWYKRNDYTDIFFLFDKAINGMHILKKSYGKFETIQHTIDYYISILDGTISSNHFLNNQFELMKTDSLNTEISSNKDGCNNSNNRKHNNYKKNDNERKNSGKRNNDINNDSNSNFNNDSNSNFNNKVNNQSGQNNNDMIKINDLELFLKKLWSKEEIQIVINLFKEFSNKEGEEDQKFIFDSIINYCMMKENKLNTYIKEKSSILE